MSGFEYLQNVANNSKATITISSKGYLPLEIFIPSSFESLHGMQTQFVCVNVFDYTLHEKIKGDQHPFAIHEKLWTFTSENSDVIFPNACRLGHLSFNFNGSIMDFYKKVLEYFDSFAEEMVISIK
ncbi:MAG: hypothetical protein ACRCXZ_00670 [Patescibacteria group bacterium]